MASLPPNRVHEGFWIDYTKGPVLGATITCTSSNANLVIAVLSVLVTFAGSHLWDLIAFIRYWRGVSNDRRSALHHQVQILARNITSPGSFLLEVAKVGWTWPRRGALASLSIEVASALLCSAGFLTVLVNSDSCGWLSWRNETTDLHREYQKSVFTNALAYLDTCYNKSNHLSQCNIFPKQAVPIPSKTYTDCPFGSMCTNHSALTLDTGLLDSNDVFGINTESSLRVKMQRVITCTPINADKYFTTRPIPPNYPIQSDSREALPGEQLLEWFIGPMIAGDRPFNSTVWQSNYRVMFSNILDLTPRSYYGSVDGTSIEGWSNSTFEPIPELRRADADTHVIIFHNNGVRFFAPTDDPIFAAHREKRVFFDNNSTETMYTADNPATFLGCTEQMRFCFNQGNCTELIGAGSAYSQAQKIAPTAQQKAIAYYLFFQTPTFNAVTRAPLLATGNAHSFQIRIPSNQWQIEVEAWVQFLLAVTQTTIPHIAAGPGIMRSDFDQLAEPLMWPGLCGSQRMGAPDGFSNINVFALVFVVALCACIILTNMTLVPTLKYIHGRNGQNSLRMKSWIQDSILHVQRKAYEGAGFSEWRGQDAAVPRTQEDILLPGLGTETYLRGIDERELKTRDTRGSNSPNSALAASQHRVPPPSALPQLLQHSANSTPRNRLYVERVAAQQEIPSPLRRRFSTSTLE